MDSADKAAVEQLLRVIKSGKLDAALREMGWTKKEQAAPKQHEARSADAQKKEPAKASTGGKGKGTGTLSKTTKGAKKGWVTMSRRAPPPEERIPDTLIQTGFSAPVRETIVELRSHGSGICLASKTDTEQAFLEVKAVAPCAVLCSVKLQETAKEVHVLVKDGKGKEQARRRFLHQLGQIPVTYLCEVPQGPPVVADYAKMVVTFTKTHSGETWASAVQKPHAAISSWISDAAQVEEVLRLQAPWHALGQSVASVAWVHKRHREKMLRSSGMNDGFCRDFLEKDQEPSDEFKLVPLPFEQDLASARRTASCYGEDVLGIVPCSRGYALRVRKEKYAAILANIHAEKAGKFTGTKYEVRGVPSYWGKDEIRAFLANWGAEPLYFKDQGRFSRMWIVSAQKAPATYRLQHTDGLATISEAEQRRGQGPPMQRWQNPRKRNSQGPAPQAMKEQVPKPAQATDADMGEGGNVPPAPPTTGLDGLITTVSAIVAEALEPLKAQILEVARVRADLDRFRSEWDAAAQDVRETNAAVEREAEVLAREKEIAERAEADKSKGSRGFRPY